MDGPHDGEGEPAAPGSGAPSPVTPGPEPAAVTPGSAAPTGPGATGSPTTSPGAAATHPRPTPDLSGGFTAAVAGGDWPATVAGTIEGVVTSVHDRFIRPMIVAARGVVFGLIIATMALLLTVVLCVAVIRLLTVYVFDGRVWASDLLVGGLFCLAGLAAWTQRTSRSTGG
jgi:hypothetical protein